MWIELSFGTALLIAVVAIYMKNKAAMETAEEDYDVFVTYSDYIPGHEVKNVIGYIESSSVMPAEGDYPV